MGKGKSKEHFKEDIPIIQAGTRMVVFEKKPEFQETYIYNI